MAIIEMSSCIDSSSAGKQGKNAELVITKILTYKRNDRSNGADHICQLWQPPNREELLTVLRQLKKTTTAGDYELHSDYPCFISGQLQALTDTYTYELNAGGYLILSRPEKNEEVRFCCGSDTSLLRYFLSIEHDLE